MTVLSSPSKYFSGFLPEHKTTEITFIRGSITCLEAVILFNSARDRFLSPHFAFFSVEIPKLNLLCKNCKSVSLSSSLRFVVTDKTSGEFMTLFLERFMSLIFGCLWAR